MDWTPASDGNYAGTCIFLIAFATIFRALLAVRFHFYPLKAAVDTHCNGGTTPPAYAPSRDRDERLIQPRRFRWRAKEAVLLGSIDLMLAGVGYLLSVPPTSPWKHIREDIFENKSANTPF